MKFTKVSTGEKVYTSKEIIAAYSHLWQVRMALADLDKSYGQVVTASKNYENTLRFGSSDLKKVLAQADEQANAIDQQAGRNGISQKINEDLESFVFRNRRLFESGQPVQLPRNVMDSIAEYLLRRYQNKVKVYDGQDRSEALQTVVVDFISDPTRILNAVMNWRKHGARDPLHSIEKLFSSYANFSGSTLKKRDTRQLGDAVSLDAKTGDEGSNSLGDNLRAKDQGMGSYAPGGGGALSTMNLSAIEKGLVQFLIPQVRQNPSAELMGRLYTAIQHLKDQYEKLYVVSKEERWFKPEWFAGIPGFDMGAIAPDADSKVQKMLAGVADEEAAPGEVPAEGMPGTPGLPATPKKSVLKTTRQEIDPDTRSTVERTMRHVVNDAMQHMPLTLYYPKNVHPMPHDIGLNEKGFDYSSVVPGQGKRLLHEFVPGFMKVPGEVAHLRNHEHYLDLIDPRHDPEHPKLNAKLFDRARMHAFLNSRVLYDIDKTVKEMTMTGDNKQDKFNKSMNYFEVARELLPREISRVIDEYYPELKPEKEQIIAQHLASVETDSKARAYLQEAFPLSSAILRSSVMMKHMRDRGLQPVSMSPDDMKEIAKATRETLYNGFPQAGLPNFNSFYGIREPKNFGTKGPNPMSGGQIYANPDILEGLMVPELSRWQQWQQAQLRRSALNHPLLPAGGRILNIKHDALQHPITRIEPGSPLEALTLKKNVRDIDPNAINLDQIVGR